MEEPSPAGVAVLAFYYETQRNGLVTDMESQCKTHCLTPFREVWPTTAPCIFARLCYNRLTTVEVYAFGPLLPERN